MSAGAPVVPGSNPQTVVEGAVVFVDKINLPVTLKVIVGGGGKGIYVVQKRVKLEALFSLAPSKALVEFGDRTVFA